MTPTGVLTDPPSDILHPLPEMEDEGSETVSTAPGTLQRPAEARRPLPTIVRTDQQLRDVPAKAMSAIHFANPPPTLFQRGVTVRLLPKMRSVHHCQSESYGSPLGITS